MAQANTAVADDWDKGIPTTEPSRVPTVEPARVLKPFSYPLRDDPDKRWRDLYGGLEGLDRRLEPAQTRAFTALDKISRDPSEARARAINQSFIGEKLGMTGAAVDSNWSAVKSAFAKKELAIDSNEISDKSLYGWIGQRLKPDDGGPNPDKGEIKPWGWKEALGSDAYMAKRNASAFLGSLFKPFAELPAAPEDLPDVWYPGAAGGDFPFNPAVAAGVYNGAIKPLVDGLASPGGIATLGAMPALETAAATSTAAKAAFKGITGLFTGLMAAGTYEAGSELKRLRADPNSTTQQQIAALSGVVSNGALAVLGAFGTAMGANAERAPQIAKAVEGKTPAQAAEILRQEAVAATPEGADALNQAAAKLEALPPAARAIVDRAGELGLESTVTDSDRLVGGEKITAAAVKAPDGTISEGTTHEALKSEIAQLPAKDVETAYPVLQPGALSDGRVVRAEIPNTGSISSSLTDYETVPGVRDIPMSEFTLAGRHYSVEGQARIDRLAQEIKASGEINPLIVVQDAEGLYILEGSTRADALHNLGAKSFPAIVVRDLESLGELAARSKGTEEGFVTSTGRFVDKTEARAIAENAGQLKPAETTGITPKAAETAAATNPAELQAHEVEMAEPPIPSAFGQTSLKDAYGELERVAYGFPEATPTEQRNMAERWARSEEVLARNPEAGRILAERLKGDPNIGLTDDQSAVLLRHKVGLQRALNEAADAAVDPNSSPELKEEARRQARDLSDQLVQLLDAVNKRGSEWGREGRWRQAIAREDYSFAAQETLLRASKGGAELTASERESLLARVKTLEEATARYEAKIAELQARPREEAVAETVRAMAKPPTSPRRVRTSEAIREKLDAKAEEAMKRIRARAAGGAAFAGIDPAAIGDLAIVGASKIYGLGLDFAAWSAEMIKDFGEKARPALAEVWEASKKLFHAENRSALLGELKAMGAEERSRRLGPFAQELARTKIEEGLKDRDAVVDAVWSDLKEADPGITRREAMDAISGYGVFKPLSHDEITDQLRDLKGQMQQVAKLEDMAAGEAPKKTGVERRAPSDEERRLQQEVEAKKKEGGYAITDPEKQLRSALQSVKRNLENRIKDLARELETGEARPKGEEAPTDPRAEALKALRDRIADTVKEVAESPEVSPEDRIKKAVRSTSSAIERLERRLEEGKIFPDVTKTSEPWSPALSKLKAQLEELRAFRKEMQDFAKPKRTPEEVALDAVKSNLQRQIDALEAQIATKTKAAKAKRSVALDAEADGLKLRRDELRVEFDRIFGRRTLSDEQRLNIWKAGATRRLADLEERLAAKDFEPKARRPLPLDNEAAVLKGQIERIRQDFAIERTKAEEAGQPRWFKALRTTADLARASAISGYHTLGKLAMFSLARFAEAPIYEAAGALIRRLPGVKAIAAKANLEAGAEASGIAKFYVRAATRGARDALETLKTGKSGLKAELGDPRHNAQPIRWYDYFGISHMAEKSPLLRGDFELRLEKATEWAVANGLDVTDPLVSGALRKDAFDYAQRAILMEDNALADAINGFMRRFEAVNPKTGRIDVAKAGLAWFVKTFLTKGIVKTPANYVAQTIARTPIGLAKGTAQLVVSHMRGIDKLTPEEANTIIRLMKAGSVGTAVFVWGAIDASKDPKDRIFGGYYQPGEKRGEADVGFGHIRVGSLEIPHIFSHNPLTESAQMGSTFYRVMKSRVSKAKGGDEKGALAGAAAVLAALASQAPIVSPITREVQQVERGEVDKFAYEAVAGLIPMFVQNLAADLDDNRSRKPENFEQTIERALPGLRENVPLTKAQKQRDVKARLKKR